MKEVNPQLIKYVEENVLPKYDCYDAAHSKTHILTVIEQSFEICEWLERFNPVSESNSMPDAGLNADMVYAIAAYHDIGVCEGRKLHHISSGRILMEDTELTKWFSPMQLAIMKEAVEDHRASSESVPRSIYGKIVSEADKIIDPDVIISRTILYGIDNFPELVPKEQYLRCVSHLKEKYGDGGYLHFQFENSPNAEKLAEFRELIRNPEALKQEYSKFSIHPLEPFLPANAEVLFLGSFPPPEARWSMNFYYPNFQNDMWRILGLVFYEDKNYFVKEGKKGFDYDKVVSFCHKIGLAIYDAAYMIKRERGNASDNFLKVMVPADLKSVLSKIPQCNAVVSTGGKSAEITASVLGCNIPEIGSYTEVYVDCGGNAGSLQFDKIDNECNRIKNTDGVSDLSGTETDGGTSNVGSVCSSNSDKDTVKRCIRFYRMPSSSRAYPMPIEKKAEIYRKLFSDLTII